MKLFSIRVTNKQDMAKLEEVVASLLGGERGKCSFIRSHEFVQLRLKALYPRKQDAVRTQNISVYCEGLKLTLTPTGTMFVLTTEPYVEPQEELDDAPDSPFPEPLGKRALRPWDSCE